MPDGCRRLETPLVVFEALCSAMLCSAQPSTLELWRPAADMRRVHVPRGPHPKQGATPAQTTDGPAAHFEWRVLCCAGQARRLTEAIAKMRRERDDQHDHRDGIVGALKAAGKSWFDRGAAYVGRDPFLFCSKEIRSAWVPRCGRVATRSFILDFRF